MIQGYIQDNKFDMISISGDVDVKQKKEITWIFTFNIGKLGTEQMVIKRDVDEIQVPKWHLGRWLELTTKIKCLRAIQIIYVLHFSVVVLFLFECLIVVCIFG